MKGKIVFWVIATIVGIGWDYYRHGDLRKSLIASAVMVYVSSMAVVGITMRPILPLFAVHYLSIVASWVVLVYYVWRGKMFWWVLVLPLLSVAAFVGLNFLEGSRYER
jgi:hypothetical protein